jgi:hypothetical protein
MITTFLIATTIATTELISSPCQKIVCSTDPYCCEVAWDIVCHIAANQICCTGDINDNGVVDGADLGLLLSSWSMGGLNRADLNSDLVVDAADLGLLLGSWGTCN